MNKWEQFEYILKCTLPSYRSHTRLSLSVDYQNSTIYDINQTYTWRLYFKSGSGLYEELIGLSKFCGIEWEHQFWDEKETILEMSEYSHEIIKPIYW
jgi:hypothetical protein